jgi:hypothetical protein
MDISLNMKSYLYSLDTSTFTRSDLIKILVQNIGKLQTYSEVVDDGDGFLIHWILPNPHSDVSESSRICDLPLLDGNIDRT